MKVYNLTCDCGHHFEGWFTSEQDFEGQASAKQIECPVCDSAEVTRLPSAPRLNLARSEAPAAAPSPVAQDVRWLEIARQVIANTEDVGERFAEEVRRIHYQEAEARGIRGVATGEEYRALVEEGIDVAPFPLPDALKQTLQ